MKTKNSETMGTREAAEYLGIDTKTIRALDKAGALPRCNGEWRRAHAMFERSTIDRLKDDLAKRPDVQRARLRAKKSTHCVSCGRRLPKAEPK